jgi:hypothetical protein
VSFYLSIIALAIVKRWACTGSSATLVRLGFCQQPVAACASKGFSYALIE